MPATTGWLRRGAQSMLARTSIALLVVVVLALGISEARAQSLLSEYLDTFAPAEIMEGATRLGDIDGDPPAAPIFRGDELAGYAFLNSDLVNSVGYSGKPIHVVVGLDLEGTITGAKLVDHHEPIVLIGIPEESVRTFIAGYAGRNIVQETTTPSAEHDELDIISGATVTVMVIDDSIRRAAIRLARARGLGGLAAAGIREQRFILRDVPAEELDWETLVGDGSVKRLVLSVGEVTAAFERAGDQAAAARPESQNPDDTFIELYAGLATIPTIGRSLLGERGYPLMTERLPADRHALVLAGNGLYSFKGSGYVRGGIFDRIRVIQGDNAFRFRDRDHRRIADIMAEGAPRFREIGVFTLPEGFDPTVPWRLELLVQREISARDKSFTTFDLGYSLPARFLEEVPAPAAEPVVAQREVAATGEARLGEQAARDALWQRIWNERWVAIGILLVLLLAVTAIFFFQDWLVRRRKLATIIRYSLLAIVLVWLGWYANAQLSVVNVLTFSTALLGDFNWAYFLLDPLIFILWFSVAAGLLFWGRGAFCGWLCPFGALQEITNRIGRYFRIPQVEVPWALNERLWPIKYIIFLVLFGAALYSLSLSEQLAEVEPFKTAIILKFVRSWPFVAFAVGLLVIGLFIERFFCRYMCPLGAALGIPARIRMFDWLKRYSDCGNPCQRCANICPVQAIHPDGRINVNECIYCLDCQLMYYDEQRCPHVIQVNIKRERRLMMASDSTLSPKEKAEKERLVEKYKKKPARRADPESGASKTDQVPEGERA